ncbi:MAG: HD domain-containing protein [Polyangiales bacterium]
MDETRATALRKAVEAKMTASDPAHDYLHVLRVEKTARELAAHEGAELDVVVAAALCHELFNYPKDHPESARSGEVCADHARALLGDLSYPDTIIAHVAEAIRVHAFSAGLPAETIEAKVLQDADRLDAIGAIGIARFFATSASMKRPFYATVDPFCRQRPPDDKQYALDHYYKKLARIPDRLNTAHAKGLAVPRMAAMNEFVRALMRELAASTIDPLPAPPRSAGMPMPVSPPKKV